MSILPIKKEILDYYKSIPKCELHAHLNGSIRENTLRSLLKANGTTISGHIFDSYHNRTLSECFTLFDLIHKVTNSTEVISKITREMLEDFSAENCKHLEIRTTPRSLRDCTSEEYVDLIIDEIQNSHAVKSKQMNVSLVLSINRGSHDLNDALRVVEIATKKRIVSGIDFSGNPFKGKFADFLPAFQLARNKNLKTTLHFAEKMDPQESMKMLDFAPDRIGHANYLNTEIRERLLKMKIPLEICLSSNVATESVKSYQLHHLSCWVKNDYPVVICTDDLGIFRTSLSKEYAFAEQYTKIPRKLLTQIAKKSFQYKFPKLVLPKLH
ncbi:adenosine deaminase-like protein [Anaeramoeba flamelloides]|uniref:Adenosine deaminase-like protein n=1 Tax=Anaeramoeba flamelloides TaxID=1746091 RepID=A0AAV7Z4W3_9EUKA|nr:adenosine deaminase-like protein [Anaeramoeba flamelloides]